MSSFLSEQGKSFTAPEQAKSNPARRSTVFDSSLENDKTPSADLNVDQRLGTVGETIPIVFGKRVSSKGGTWVKPPLIKTGTHSYKGSYLYVMSQGEISSSPTKSLTWVGLNNVAFLDDQTITLTNKYTTAAALTTTSSTCPIADTALDGLYCGIKTYTFIQEMRPATVDGTSTELWGDVRNDYTNVMWKTVGTGDTTQISYDGTYKLYDAETGADITSAYGTWIGSSSFTWSRNRRYDTSAPFALLGGHPVGYIKDYITDGSGWASPLVDEDNEDDNGGFDLVAGGRSDFIAVYTTTSVSNPTAPGQSATTGTLDGVLEERIHSDVANPQTRTDINNASYADITFLKVIGNIYEQVTQGTFPTSAKQLYIFCKEGVKVDLYSSGLSSGSYTVGASNQFIDLAMYLFKSYKQTAGSTTAEIATPVYLTNLQSLCSFCTNYSLAFNGVLSQSVNIVEFISSIAPFFLLSFLSVGGRFRFAPVLPLNSSNQIDVTALSPTLTFTEANIIPGSFEKGYLSVEDRRDFIANVLYRESDTAHIGAQRIASVRYPSASIDSPVEQYDCTQFCVDSAHGVIYAKYELARRKYSTHNISFSTPLLTTELIPTDIIKITRQRKSSTVDADRSETEWYQVTRVSHGADGLSKIEASHFPVNGSSISLISNEVVNGTFTVLS